MKQENSQIIIEINNWQGERLFAQVWDPSKLTPTLGTILVQVGARIKEIVESENPTKEEA